MTDQQTVVEIRTLPQLGKSTEPETLAAYGLRILAFVIAEECTATLSDTQLETADHFYPLAVANLDPERFSPSMIDRLADARRMIQSTLRWRVADAQAAQDAAQAKGMHASKPIDPKVLNPTLPKTEPPAPVFAVPFPSQVPQKVEIEF